MKIKDHSMIETPRLKNVVIVLIVLFNKNVCNILNVTVMTMS